MKYVCLLCGYEYDASVGDADNGIREGTEFDELPEDWKCPLCGAPKDDFDSQKDDDTIEEEE